MWAVAADVVSGESSQPIVVALISALGGVLVAAVGALVSVARRESRDEHPPALPSLGERTAVLERRAEDNDGRDDVQDRHLERIDRRQERGERRTENIERFLDRTHPEWRP